MIKEVLTYGSVFGAVAAGADTVPQRMAFTKDTYDFRDAARRPPGWFDVRARRLQAQERTLGRDHASVVKPKDKREIDVSVHQHLQLICDIDSLIIHFLQF
jgi:hypothetical protein